MSTPSTTGLPDVICTADARWQAALQATQQAPGDVLARRKAAALALEQGRVHAVLQLLPSVLRRLPDDAEAHGWMAQALSASGRGAEAQHLLQSCLQRDPQNRAFMAVFAQFLIDAGKHGRAIRVATQLVQRSPQDASGWRVLGLATAGLGHHNDGCGFLRRAVQLAPLQTTNHRALAHALLRGPTPEAARAPFQDLLALAPDDADALLHLGALCMHGSDIRAAIDLFERALATAPDSDLIWANLGTAWAHIGNIPRARLAFDRMGPRPHTSARKLLADFLATYDDPARSIVEYESLIATSPRPDRRLEEGLGHALSRAGRHEDARARIAPFVEAGTAGPNALAAWTRALIRQKRPGDAIAPLEHALASTTTANQRQLLFHTLGEAREAAGDMGGAFAAHAEAHRQIPLRFEPRALQARARATREMLPPEALRQVAPAEDEHGQPGQGVIFILGMPRSGTSMIEQIIASHPESAAAGELPHLPEIIGAAGDLASVASLRDLLAQSPVERAALGRAYEALLHAQTGQPGARIQTDKLPGNFLHIGAIDLILPGARIIHCRRDALDTCLSCYFQNFTLSYAPLTRLDTLGWFYRGYADLMDHWRTCSTLPMLELDYARTVDDLETWARKIIAFVGLDWHPDCARFHQTRRPVATASYDQVRQPVYRTSVLRSRRYLDQLGPLIDALGDRAPKDIRPPSPHAS